MIEIKCGDKHLNLSTLTVSDKSGVNRNDDSPRYYYDWLKSVPSNTKMDIIYVLGYGCNYSCDYCYQKPARGETALFKEENLSKVDAFINLYMDKYAKDVTVAGIGLIGGEPLLPMYCNTITSIINHHDNKRISIATNGTYIEEYLSLLKGRDVLLRVSLDGAKDTHYSRRKPLEEGAYEKAIKGIEKAILNDIQVLILTVFNRDKINEYPLFFDLLESLGWGSTSNIKMSFLQESEQGCDGVRLDDVIKNIKSYQRLAMLDERAKRIDVERLFPGVSQVKRAINLRKNGYYNPYRCDTLSQAELFMMPDGSVRSCLTYNNEAGRIGTYMPYLSIDDKKINAMQCRRVDAIPQCKSCDYQLLCLGGCPASCNPSNKEFAPFCGIWKEKGIEEYLKIIGGYNSSDEQLSYCWEVFPPENI